MNNSERTAFAAAAGKLWKVKTAILSSCVGVLAMAAPAQAALIYDFQLNGSYANAAGPGSITSSGGSLGAGGYTFGVNQGLVISLSSTLSVYTIETAFRFDGDSYGLSKILDFKSNNDDNGLYLTDGKLGYYPWATGGPSVASGEIATIKISRDAAGLLTVGLNGADVFQFIDTSGSAIFDAGAIGLFRDDTVYPDQQRPGFVDYVRVYDTASLTSGVPEPASWAMMIIGFGAVGSMVRTSRRRNTCSAA